MRFALFLTLWLAGLCTLAQQRAPRPTNGLTVTTDLPLPGVQPTCYVRGRTLFDPCGSAVVLKGVNKMVFFDNADPEGAATFPEIAKSGANCVRIVWQMKDDNTGRPSSTQRLDRIITNARQNGLLPIVGLWDFTNTPDGGFSKLSEYADYWTRSDVVAVIRKHQKCLIINIANEAARKAEAGGNEDNSTDRDTFANKYNEVVNQLRRARVTVPLMIDGMDQGKSLRGFTFIGPGLLAKDPQHNLLFSFHAYWPKQFTDGTTLIADAFVALRSVNIAVVIGELAKYGADPTGNAPCSDAGLADYQEFVRQADRVNIGWLLWEWGPRVPADCPEMSMTLDGKITSLANIPTTDRRFWMRELALDAPNSIRKTARRTPFIQNSFVGCPGPRPPRP